MTLLRNLAESRSTLLERPAVPLTNESLMEWLNIGTKTDAGVAVTETTALKITAVYRAVSIVGGVLASLPVKAYRMEGSQVRDLQPLGDRERTEIRSLLLEEPHPEYTPFEFWELVFVHLLLWGNAYRFKTRDNLGRIRQLSVIPPSRVRVGRSDDGTKIFEVQLDSGEVRPYTSEEILHIPGLGYDGLVGLSPIGHARQGLGLALAAEKYGAKLFGSGTLMSGILTTDRKLDEPAATALKKRWQEKVAGVDQSHEIAVLDAGAQFQPVSIPPEDAQFIETRRFGVTEVARLFGIPPHLLMETDKSTSWGTGIEEQNRGLITFTFNPFLVRRDQRVSKELFPVGVHAESVTEALLRGDTLKRYTAYGMAIKDGWLSRAEARRRENLPVDDESLEEFIEPATGGEGGTTSGADAVSSDDVDAPGDDEEDGAE